MTIQVFFSKPTLIETKIANGDINGEEIIFNWQSFFGGQDRIFPASVIWENKLIKELKETKDWIARNRNNRIIRLTGSRRNSTAITIGHTFSAVSGFNIEMEHRGDFWKTIHYPTSSTPDYPISINYKAGRTKKLVVVVSIMKVNVPKDVLTFLESTEDIDNSILEVTSELPIVSSDQANIAVHKIKEEIKKHVQKLMFLKFISSMLDLPTFLCT